MRHSIGLHGAPDVSLPPVIESLLPFALPMLPAIVLISVFPRIALPPSRMVV